ncbi:hypothetical protein FO519_006185 [Halicephalobus sp. NKZ332]|nr:hypothetical protein FO519_006185 [Halicephalobus sp. NKZ332]
MLFRPLRLSSIAGRVTVMTSAPQSRKERFNELYKNARNLVFETVESQSPNLGNALYQPLQSFFFELKNSLSFRQRFFMGLAYIDLMKADPYELPLEKRMEIISEYIFVAGQNLKELEKDGSEFLEKEVEEKLDQRMIEDGVVMLCNMKVKYEKHYIIERLLNLSDLNSKYSVITLKELKKQIEFNPGIVLSWISGFKLLQFHQENLKELAISCLVHKIDLQNSLLLSEESRKIQMLRAAYDHPRIFKKVFSVIRHRDPEIADSFIYEVENPDLVNLQPWDELPSRKKESLVCSRDSVKSVLEVKNPYMMPVNSGDFQIHWIGSQEQWPHLLQWLQPRSLIGFDVEANFVCQNSNGVQQIPLKKEERAGNWENRPLRTEQMVYAARDAHYLITIYNDMVHTIYNIFREDGEAKEFIDGAVVVTVEQNPGSSIQSVIGNRKSNSSDVFLSINNMNAKISDLTAENGDVKVPEEVTVVVDTPLLKVVPVLRRCGYRTYDYREKVNEGSVKAATMNQILSDFIKENINTNMYFLSNRFPFTMEKFAGKLKSRWIHVHQDQSESSILENIMMITKTMINVDDYKSRCTKCCKKNTSFEMEIEVYRVIYRAFTKVKQYFEKKIGPSGVEEDEKDKELLKNFEKVGFMDEGRVLTIRNESGEIFKFLIDGSEAKVECPEGIVKEYKAVNSLFDDKNLTSVRFCTECAVFF